MYQQQIVYEKQIEDEQDIEDEQQIKHLHQIGLSHVHKNRIIIKTIVDWSQSRPTIITND